ncbi:mucin-2-like [Musca vetustissima]|uniref:mucin-2-like n=1 Tax=Musca vetustissima TaxID=27455 RepID=UPI002AB67DE4|nr:mucin-2-like [Musca vetustissima]
MFKLLLLSAVLIISCCSSSHGRYLGHSLYRPQPYNPYHDYGYPPPHPPSTSIGFPHQVPTSYYPAGTYFDQRRGILRPFPGGGVPIIVDYHKRCSGNYIGLKPHPDERQYYYVCKPDAVIFGRCQRFQQFNTTCGQCVQIKPTEYEPKCTAEGRFPIHSDCHLYYKCDKTLQPQIYSCPHNMIFSQQTSKCIPGNRCIPTQIITDNDSVPEYCENKYPACQQNGVFRSPSDCSLYYTCELQENRVFYQTRFKCPGETFYDLQTNCCRPKDQVPCDCITLAELVYPTSHLRPYHPFQQHPMIHPSEFDLDSLENIEHATESSSEEELEEPRQTEFEDSESNSLEEEVIENTDDSEESVKNAADAAVTPIRDVTTESSAEMSVESLADVAAATSTVVPAITTEIATEAPEETTVPTEAVPEATTEVVVSTEVPEANTEEPATTDDDENDKIEVLGSDVDFGDRFVLQDDKTWNNDGPGKTIFLGIKSPSDSDSDEHDKHHDHHHDHSHHGSHENTSESSHEANNSHIETDEEKDENKTDEHGSEEASHGSGENSHGAGEDSHGSGENNHESGENNHGSGENNHGTGENSQGSGEGNHGSGENGHGSGEGSHGSGENGHGSEENGHKSEEGSHDSSEGNNEEENETTEPPVSQSTDATTTTDIDSATNAPESSENGQKPCNDIATDTQTKLHTQKHCSTATQQNSRTATLVDKTTNDVIVNARELSTLHPNTTPTTHRDPTINDVIDPRLHHANQTPSTTSTRNTTPTPKKSFEITTGDNFTQKPKTTPRFFDPTTNDVIDIDTQKTSTWSTPTTLHLTDKTTNDVISTENIVSTQRTITTPSDRDSTIKGVIDQFDSFLHHSKTAFTPSTLQSDNTTPMSTSTHRDPTIGDVRNDESSTLSTPVHKTTKDWLQEFELVFGAKQGPKTPTPIEGEFLPLDKSEDLLKHSKEHKDSITEEPTAVTSSKTDFKSVASATESEGIKLPIGGTEQPVTKSFIQGGHDDLFDDDEDEEPSVLSDEIVIPDSGTEEPETAATPARPSVSEEQVSKHEDKGLIPECIKVSNSGTDVPNLNEVTSELSSAKFSHPDHDDIFDDDNADDEPSVLSDEIVIPDSGTEAPTSHNIPSATDKPKLAIPKLHTDPLTNAIQIPITGTEEPIFHNSDSFTTIDPDLVTSQKPPSARLFDQDHDDVFGDDEPSVLSDEIIIPDSGTEDPESNEKLHTTVRPKSSIPGHFSFTHKTTHTSVRSDAIKLPITGTEEPNFNDSDRESIITSPKSIAAERHPSPKLIDPGHNEDIFDDDEPSVLSDEIVIPDSGTEDPNSSKTLQTTAKPKTKEHTTPKQNSTKHEDDEKSNLSDVIKIPLSGTEEPSFTDADSFTTTPGPEVVFPKKLPSAKLFDPEHDDIFEDDEPVVLSEEIIIPDSGTEEPVANETTTPTKSVTSNQTISSGTKDIQIPNGGTEDPTVINFEGGATTFEPELFKPMKLLSPKLIDPQHDDIFDDDDDEDPSVLSDEIIIPDSGTEEPLTVTTSRPKSAGSIEQHSHEDSDTTVLPSDIKIPISGTEQPSFNDFDGSATTSAPGPTLNKKIPSAKLIDPDHDDIFDDDDDEPSVLSDEIIIPDSGTEQPSSKEILSPSHRNDDIKLPISGTEEPDFNESVGATTPTDPDLVNPKKHPVPKLLDPDHDDIFDDDEPSVLSDEIIIPNSGTEAPDSDETTLRPKTSNSKKPQEDDDTFVDSDDLKIPVSGTETPDTLLTPVPIRKSPPKLIDPDHESEFENDFEGSGFSDDIKIPIGVTEEPNFNPSSSLDPDYDLENDDASVLSDDINIPLSGTEEPESKAHPTTLLDPDYEHDEEETDDNESVFSNISHLPSFWGTEDTVAFTTISPHATNIFDPDYVFDDESDIKIPISGTDGPNETTTPSSHSSEEEDETNVLSDEIVIPIHTTDTPHTTSTPSPPTTTPSSIEPPITHSRSTEVQTTPTPTPKYLDTKQTQTNNNRSEFSLHFRQEDGCPSESLVKPSEQNNIYISLLNLDTNKPVNNTNSTNIPTTTNLNQTAVKPPPCEPKKASLPRLEIFVERPMDVRFVICPKTCTKDHKHNYDEKDNRAVHLKWYPNRSNQTLALETSNRLKIDG